MLLPCEGPCWKLLLYAASPSTWQEEMVVVDGLVHLPPWPRLFPCSSWGARWDLEAVLMQKGSRRKVLVSKLWFGPPCSVLPLQQLQMVDLLVFLLGSKLKY